MGDVEMVGMYREFGDGSASPFLRDSMYALPELTSSAVADYLESGFRVSASPGVEVDVLNGELLSAPRAHMTDGRFLWRTDLAYYVRKYRVAVAQDLIGVALSGANPPLSLTDDQWEAIRRWFDRNP